jgi:hypothetical protein
LMRSMRAAGAGMRMARQAIESDRSDCTALDAAYAPANWPTG